MKYIVVAGTRAEYEKFILKKAKDMFAVGQTSVSFSDFVYATADSIRGYSDPHGWFVGSWRNREDIKEILMLLRVAQRTPNDALEKISKSL